MDLIQKLMNIVLPPIALIVLLFIVPPFLVFKFLSYIIRFICSENVAGKVVLITGASSGIGEYLAYEYARRGACLVLAARRVDRLREVADKARHLGSPDVMVVGADVSNVEDCKRLIQEAVNYFGQLDHLVNNAGIAHASIFEDINTISDLTSIMDVNFWGSVQCTHFAIPHLRKSKGKIVVVASTAGWFSTPRMCIYNASKAAIITFYDTLRIEFGSDIGITIVAPGVIESEMSHEYQSKAHGTFVPVASTEGCAKAIVNSTCRREKYLTEPSWVSLVFLTKVLCPDVLEWCLRWIFIIRPRIQTSKTDAKKSLYPTSIQSPELKTD